MCRSSSQVAQDFIESKDTVDIIPYLKCLKAQSFNQIIRLYVAKPETDGENGEWVTCSPAGLTERIRGRTTASQLDVRTLWSTLQHCSPSLKPTGSGTYHRRHLDQLIYLSRTNKQCPRTASS
ncbi:hypothetical protein J6590_063901 [Homalodisca vitripennis]|nr:hypothetical protein J6590_063901 [Homalodisca vitripennis]